MVLGGREAGKLYRRCYGSMTGVKNLEFSLSMD